MNRVLLILASFIFIGTLYGIPTLREMDESFDSIGKKYEIPSELLKALAYRNSNWDPLYSSNTGDNPNEKGRFGIMGLRAMKTLDSIDTGARVLNIDSFKGVSDYKTNIEMAAASIQRVKLEFIKNGFNVESIEDYFPILVMYLDFTPSLKYYAERFVLKMFKDIDMGYSIEYGDESINIRGKAIDFSKLTFTTNDTSIPILPSVSAPSGVRWVPAHSTNYRVANRTAADIDTIVIHQAAGTYEGCVSWFAQDHSKSNCGTADNFKPCSPTSAHYCISKEGEITQMVKIKDVAWHAGNLNGRSIGIEHEGKATANLFTETEYQASAMLVKWLAETYTATLDKSHIVRHHGNCPGPYWNWEYYWTLLLGNSSEGTIEFLEPQNGATVGNPVTFKAKVTGDVVKVKYFADDTYFLGESTDKASNFTTTYSFVGVDRARNVIAKGYDAAGNLVSGAEHRISFTPTNVGTGSVRFINPTNNGESPNPATLTATISGDVKMVKYFADDTYQLGESADASTQFKVEYKFNTIGWRVLQVKGYNAQGVLIPGAIHEIRVNILDQPACIDECELGVGGCFNRNQTEIAGRCEKINGCNKLVIDAICPAEDRCESGVCIKNISGNCHHDCIENSYICFETALMKCIDYDNDGCFEWKAEENCGDNQVCTINGCADVQCSEQCREGESRCSGSYVQECGQFNSDSCMEWGNTNACEEGKTCRNGVCANSSITCTNQCVKGTLRCSGNKIESCKLSETTGCYGYVAEKTCSTSQVCASGRCIGDSTVPNSGDITDPNPVDNGGGSSGVDNGGLDTGVGLSCSKSNAIDLSGRANGTLTLPFNFTDTKDTKNATLRCFDKYPPNELNESGPEYLYVFTVTEDALFSAWIKSPEPANTDIDLHLIQSLDRTDPKLVERGQYRVESRLRPGTYYLSMDTFVSSGVEQKGKYELTVSVQPANVTCDRAGAIDLSGTANGTISLPFTYTDSKDTRNSTKKCFDTYPPNDLNQGGPEYLYVFTISEKAFFSAAIATPEPSGTDIDIHLIKSLDPRNPALVTRGDKNITATLQPGTYYLSMDTYVSDNGEMKGSYALSVSITSSSHAEVFPTSSFPFPALNTTGVTSLTLWSTWYNLNQATASSGGVAIRDIRGNSLGVYLTLEDWCKSAMQGTVRVKLLSGEYVLYGHAGKTDAFKPDCSRWYNPNRFTVEKNKFAISDGPFGRGARYYVLPYRSIAVDSTVIPYGTVLYIPDARGKQVTLPNGTIGTHDGYFFAADTGSAIKGNHIDTFIGPTTVNPFSHVKSTATGTFKAYIVNDANIKNKLLVAHQNPTENARILIRALFPSFESEFDEIISFRAENEK